jgi:hypothetical protein
MPILRSQLAEGPSGAYKKPGGLRRSAAMNRRLISAKVSAIAAALVIAAPALAQAGMSGTPAAPDYGSGASAGALSDHNFNTPESDGRPGVKFFAYGVQAFKKGDTGTRSTCTRSRLHGRTSRPNTTSA